MANLTITAANIISTGTRGEYTAGGTVTRGMAVRRNTSGLVVEALSDTAANATVLGVALNDAGANQPVTVHTEGPLAFGAILTAGHPYFLGTASGTIKPVSDIAGTEFSSLIGVATSTSSMYVKPINSGVLAGAAVT
jgi:hypothetical protein